jgi:hypothetical protein
MGAGGTDGCGGEPRGVVLVSSRAAWRASDISFTKMN